MESPAYIKTSPSITSGASRIPITTVAKETSEDLGLETKMYRNVLMVLSWWLLLVGMLLIGIAIVIVFVYIVGPQAIVFLLWHQESNH